MPDRRALADFVAKVLRTAKESARSSIFILLLLHQNLQYTTISTMKLLIPFLSLCGTALAGVSRPEVSVLLNAGGAEPSIDIIQPSVYWGASDTIGDFDIEASLVVESAFFFLSCFSLQLD
jgi:hypothetical protein